MRASYSHRALIRRCSATRYFIALQQPIRLAENLRQPVPVSFFWKETGTSTTAAALIAQGFAAFPRSALVGIQDGRNFSYELRSATGANVVFGSDYLTL